MKNLRLLMLATWTLLSATAAFSQADQVSTSTGETIQTVTTVTALEPEVSHSVVRKHSTSSRRTRSNHSVKSASVRSSAPQEAVVKPLSYTKGELVGPIGNSNQLVNDVVDSADVELNIAGDSLEKPATKSDNKSDGDKPKEIAIHVVDWSLAEVVASITQETGVNIVLASPANPKVTLRLEMMPVGDVVRVLASVAAMQSVQLKSGGYVIAPTEILKNSFPAEYEEQIGSLNPTASTNGGTKPAVKAEDMAIEIYEVQHVKPSELAEAIQSVFPDTGLIIRVGPGKRLPSAIDGTESGSGSGGSGSGGGSAPTPTGITTSTSGNGGRTLIFRGPKGIVQSASQLAKQLDVKLPQVGLKVQIHDITDDSLRDLGVSWQDSTGTKISEDNSTRSDINFGSFARSPLAFNATLRHLEKTNKAKLLAQPNVTALDGENAYILIGDRLNYPVVTSFTDAGQPIFDVREERVGIYLQFSATVNDGNLITLNLYPQVSTVTGFLEVGNQGSYPQISTREAKTSVRVKNGETVVIGGLLRDEEIRSIERVPVLGKIPILGELFTRRKNTKEKSQVVISITPTIIGD